MSIKICYKHFYIWCSIEHNHFSDTNENTFSILLSQISSSKMTFPFQPMTSRHHCTGTTLRLLCVYPNTLFKIWYIYEGKMLTIDEGTHTMCDG